MRRHLSFRSVFICFGLGIFLDTIATMIAIEMAKHFQ